MKHPFKVSILSAAALSLCCLVSSSCAAFTKDDAMDLGSYIAKESIAIAKAKLTGDDADIKTQLFTLGSNVADIAIDKVTKNLTGTTTLNIALPVASAAPEQVVEDALRQATDQISLQLGTDPQTTALAIQVATDSATQAILALSDSGGKQTASVLPAL